MTQIKKQKLMTATLFGILMLAAVFNWNAKKHSAVESEDISVVENLVPSEEVSEDTNEYSEFSSSISKQSRTLELGTVEPTKNVLKKEVEVILADPKMSEHWGIKKTSSHKAWNITMGNRDIVIAIIDTGIDINHKDLQNNLWVNKGEIGLDKNGKDKATNGIDDDGNGFKDDINGWNFSGNNNDLADNHGHGTHIAGIVGAEGGNGFGISGIAPKVSLMILKYYDPKGPGTNNLLNTVRAIRYATQNGAKVINYSGGGLEYSAEEYQAVKEASEKGILFVAAAGNERSNSDKHHYYPADYPLANIISVTAANEASNILPTSNYGQQTVDIQAPGSNIYSTLPNSGFGNMTGTSQATAFVSGVAALVYASNRDYTAEQVKKYILKTGDDVPVNMRQKTRYAKQLNSYKALATIDREVAASGVIAGNTAQMKSSTFALPEENKSIKVNSNGSVEFEGESEFTDSTSQVSAFGQSLKKLLPALVEKANAVEATPGE